MYILHMNIVKSLTAYMYNAIGVVVTAVAVGLAPPCCCHLTVCGDGEELLVDDFGRLVVGSEGRLMIEVAQHLGLTTLRS
jgi:hypothetical protein